jgi:hypothetical protein
MFFSIGVPNAFDVALLNQVNLVVVYSASYCSIIKGDGLIYVEVVIHDLRVANVLLNLEPSPHTSPIEKLNKKKRCKSGKSIECFKITKQQSFHGRSSLLVLKGICIQLSVGCVHR